MKLFKKSEPVSTFTLPMYYPTTNCQAVKTTVTMPSFCLTLELISSSRSGKLSKVKVTDQKVNEPNSWNQLMSLVTISCSDASQCQARFHLILSQRLLSPLSTMSPKQLIVSIDSRYSKLRGSIYILTIYQQISCIFLIFLETTSFDLIISSIFLLIFQTYRLILTYFYIILSNRFSFWAICCRLTLLSERWLSWKCWSMQSILPQRNRLQRGCAQLYKYKFLWVGQSSLLKYGWASIASVVTSYRVSGSMSSIFRFLSMFTIKCLSAVQGSAPLYAESKTASIDDQLTIMQKYHILLLLQDTSFPKLPSSYNLYL